jgi:group I intron endonuclease
MIVYRITNIINGKKYIGQTRQTLQHRWDSHLNNPCCSKIFKAIKEFGKENFKIEKICEFSNIISIDFLEQYFMIVESTTDDFGYNSMEGGKHNEQTRMIMSSNRTGILMTGKAARGVLRGPRPLEVGRRISLAKKGVSNSLKGRKKPYIPHPSLEKKIVAVNLLTNEEMNFKSIQIAARDLRLCRPNIMKVLKGIRYKVGEYSFRYVK